MTYLVTGATGTTGSLITRQLTDFGGVRALVRSDEGAEKVRKMGAEPILADLAKPETLTAEIFAGVEVAYLCVGAQEGMDKLEEAFIAAAAASDAKPRIVLLSSLGADPESQSIFGRMHGRSEQALLASGLDWTILRPTSFMQNFLWQAQAIKQFGAFYLPLGEARVAWLDARDIAAMAVKVMTESGHEQQIYPLTGPESLSGNELAKALREGTGVRAMYEPITEQQAAQTMLEMGLDQWLINGMSSMYKFYREGFGAETHPAVENILGRPATRFADWAKDHAAAFTGK